MDKSRTQGSGSLFAQPSPNDTVYIQTKHGKNSRETQCSQGKVIHAAEHVIKKKPSSLLLYGNNPWAGFVFPFSAATSTADGEKQLSTRVLIHSGLTGELGRVLQLPAVRALSPLSGALGTGCSECRTSLAWGLYPLPCAALTGVLTGGETSVL